jgi:hypothetical protein
MHLFVCTYTNLFVVTNIEFVTAPPSPSAPGEGRWRFKVPVLVSDLDLECALWLKVGHGSTPAAPAGPYLPYWGALICCSRAPAVPAALEPLAPRLLLGPVAAPPQPRARHPAAARLTPPPHPPQIRLAPMCPWIGTISLAFVGPPAVKVQLSPYNRVRLMRIPVLQVRAPQRGALEGQGPRMRPQDPTQPGVLDCAVRAHPGACRRLRRDSPGPQERKGGAAARPPACPGPLQAAPALPDTPSPPPAPLPKHHPRSRS